jgi:REP element-mobilizing transposase RayT
MPRGPRLDAPGTLHHVIVRGIERSKIVNDDQDRDNFISRLGALAKDTDTAIYAWALMSNHAHILLRSGAAGLPTLMRRLLSGYATSFNKRHRRYGHLFHNRYKSIVCEEDPYFRELVRYIHLNPLRAKLVDSVGKLERYKWCGHAVVLGRWSNVWQDRDYVLQWFGNKEGEARKAYREYVKEGVDQGHRPDLVGGGLVRSMGGWSVVKAMRRLGDREKGDERILGSGRFVEQLLEEASQKIKHQIPTHDLIDRAEEEIRAVCQKENIEVATLRSTSRRRSVSRLRAHLALKLVNELGLSLAETARQLGLSTSAIAQILRRNQ